VHYPPAPLGKSLAVFWCLLIPFRGEANKKEVKVVWKLVIGIERLGLDQPRIQHRAKEARLRLVIKEILPPLAVE
jgi:hypothetical protein